MQGHSFSETELRLRLLETYRVMGIHSTAERIGMSSRAAIVTGAARGIGFATAKLLASQGTAVALVDRSPAVAERASELRSAGANAIGIVADVSDADAVADAVAQARAAHGATTILVNNAGLTAVHRPWKSVTPRNGTRSWR